MTARDDDIQPLSMVGWQGGLNRDADPILLQVDETHDALNVDFGLRGHVAKRKGYSLVSSSHSTATAGDHLARFDDRYVYIDDSGKVWLTTAAFVFSAPSLDLLGTGTGIVDRQTSIAHMNDFIYMSRVSGAAASTRPFKWDKTTATQITVTAFDGTSLRFPKAAHLAHIHTRMWAANVKDSSDNVYPSRLYFSEVGNPEKWTATSYIPVGYQDGQQITGMVRYGDALLLFKNRSIYLLSGTDKDSFALYPVDISGDFGLLSPAALAVNGDKVYFYYAPRGVFEWNGSEFNQLDQKISKFIRNNLNKAEARKVQLALWQNKLYLSVPFGSATVPTDTFVLDLDTGAWTHYDYGFQSWIDADDALYGAGLNKGTPAVGIFKLQNTDQDNGANFDSYFSTAWVAPFGQAAVQRLRRADLAFSALADISIVVDMYTDMSNNILISKTISTDPGGLDWSATSPLWGAFYWGFGVQEVLARKAGWGGRWRTMRLRFSYTGNQPWQLNNLVMQISGQPRQRGEG